MEYLFTIIILSMSIFNCGLMYIVSKHNYKKGHFDGRKEGFEKGLYFNFKVTKETVINSYVDHINSRIN